MIVATPQYLWLGRLSHIVCTSRLTTEMLQLALRYGCSNEDECACASNVTSRGSVAGLALQNNGSLVGSAHDVAVDWSGRWTNAKAEPGQLNMSHRACDMARQLYARDFLLWRSLCKT